MDLKNVKQIDETTWEIPTSFKKGMNVPARIIATEKLIRDMDDGVVKQITNVATLPGIQKYAYCMPDGHWGYGFPIGGVAAFDIKEGIISPGGIGFDINCGMRLVKTNLKLKEVKPKIKQLVDTLFKKVPAGVGGKGFVKLNHGQFRDIMHDGVKWCVDNGYGWKDDVKLCEGQGKIKGAEASKVSDKAIKRGIAQLGTLGSGNHYLEVQVAKKRNVFDSKVAEAFGITEDNQIVVMVHCGSRGFGHQVGTDYLRIFNKVMKGYGLDVEDKELACAPFQSEEGQDYFKAMACAANMAFANRQVILHKIRESFSEVFGKTSEELGMDMIYDVAHNVAKIEKYKIDGKMKKVVVHRKGSTRSFGIGNSDLISKYKSVGQPVILGGSMETGSHLLVGTKKAEEETFGSTAHGSGRTMSRTKARKLVRGDELLRSMEKRGIHVRAVSMSGLAEEAGNAYKDVDEVVNTLDKAGLSKKVVGLKPIANVKG